MCLNRKRPVCGNAANAPIESPLFVRLCQSFVDNPGAILKTGFVSRVAILVQDLLAGFDDTRNL